jgi:hypothetical protein
LVLGPHEGQKTVHFPTSFNPGFIKGLTIESGLTFNFTAFSSLRPNLITLEEPTVEGDLGGEFFITVIGENITTQINDYWRIPTDDYVYDYLIPLRAETDGKDYHHKYTSRTTRPGPNKYTLYVHGNMQRNVECTETMITRGHFTADSQVSLVFNDFHLISRNDVAIDGYTFKRIEEPSVSSIDIAHHTIDEEYGENISYWSNKGTSNGYNTLSAGVYNSIYINKNTPLLFVKDIDGSTELNITTLYIEDENPNIYNIDNLKITVVNLIFSRGWRSSSSEQYEFPKFNVTKRLYTTRLSEIDFLIDDCLIDKVVVATTASSLSISYTENGGISSDLSWMSDFEPNMFKRVTFFVLARETFTVTVTLIMGPFEPLLPFYSTFDMQMVQCVEGKEYQFDYIITSTKFSGFRFNGTNGYSFDNSNNAGTATYTGFTVSDFGIPSLFRTSTGSASWFAAKKVPPEIFLTSGSDTDPGFFSGNTLYIIIGCGAAIIIIAVIIVIICCKRKKKDQTAFNAFP